MFSPFILPPTTAPEGADCALAASPSHPDGSGEPVGKQPQLHTEGMCEQQSHQNGPSEIPTYVPQDLAENICLTCPGAPLSARLPWHVGLPLPSASGLCCMLLRHLLRVKYPWGDISWGWNTCVFQSVELPSPATLVRLEGIYWGQNLASEPSSGWAFQCKELNVHNSS